MKPYHIQEEHLKSLINAVVGRNLSNAFKFRTFITGEEILAFSNHKQVNKFVLFQIYQEWNNYINKLTHPYFDFQNDEVKDGLQAFQNILSRHIKVEKFDFKVMFEKALFNNLRLILNPTESILGFFFMNKESISFSLFEKYAYYFSDFDFIISSIHSYHQKNGYEKIEKDVFLEKMNKIVELYEQKQRKDINSYRADLFFQITTEKIDDYIKFQVERPLPNLSNKMQEIKQDIQQDNNRNPPNKSIKPYSPNNEISYFEQIDNTTLDNKHDEQSGIKRIADSFKQPAGFQQFTNPNLQRKDITIDQIPIHKQFQIVQKIFSGNNNKFKETIDAINKLESFEEAEHFLYSRILNKPDIPKQDKVVIEFIQLIKNRFTA